MSQVKAIVDKLLTNVSNQLKPEGFIAEMILPPIKVKQQSGKIGKHGKEHLRIVNTVAIGRGKTPYIESRAYSDTSYYIDTHRLKTMVSKEDYANVEAPFDAEKDETSYLTTLMLLAKEKALADALADTAVLTQNETLAGTAQFSDYVNSDPIGKFKTGRLTVRSGCGFPPNVAWMDWATANTLAYHPGILASLGFTQNRAGQLTEAELAKAMGVEKLLIAKAVYNSTHKGQSDSIGVVWGKHIWMAYIPAAAGKDQQSLGYHLTFAGQQPRKIYKQTVFDPPGATDILIEDDYDQLITDASCGYLIKNAIA